MKNVNKLKGLREGMWHASASTRRRSAEAGSRATMVDATMELLILI